MFEDRDGVLHWRWPIVAVYRLRLHGWGSPAFLDRSQNRARPVPWTPATQMLLAVVNPAVAVAARAERALGHIALFP